MQEAARWFMDGGFWMYPIASISAFSIAIISERLYYYYIHCRLNGKALMQQIVKLVRDNQLDAARQLCAKTKSPLALILESALWHYQEQAPDQEIQNSVDEVALRELPRIQRGTHYLSLFANISTLLGLLGTIFGLQEAFASLTAADPAQKATLLAKGIAVGMNTTAMGLIVAVPNMIMYSVLGAKANSIIEEIDESSVRLLNFLYSQRRI